LRGLRCGLASGRRTTLRVLNKLFMDYLLSMESQGSCSQVLSFSKARKRWEILFFSTLSISAYLECGQQTVAEEVSETHVLPSYSNIGSHPGENQQVESTTSFGPYQNLLDLLLVRSGPWICQKSRPKTAQRTHVCSALEDDWLVPRAFTICKRADGLGRLIWKSGKEIIETLMAKCF